MNKTADIEEFVRLTVTSGPKTQDELVHAYRKMTTEPLTWLGIAVHKMESDGRVVFPTCAEGHNHEGDCVLEQGVAQ